MSQRATTLAKQEAKSQNTNNLKTKPHPNIENNTHIYRNTPPIIKTILDIYN